MRFELKLVLLSAALAFAVLPFGAVPLQAADTSISASTRGAAAPVDPTIAYDLQDVANRYCDGEPGFSDCRTQAEMVFHNDPEQAMALVAASDCPIAVFCLHRSGWWQGAMHSLAAPFNWAAEPPVLVEGAGYAPVASLGPQSIVTVLPSGQGPLIVQTYADGSHSVTNESMGIRQIYNLKISHLEMVGRIALHAH